MDDILKIDGSYGEGGGQILRSSLTLSLLTGKAFLLEKIRAGRSKPGLAPQHLAAIRSAAQISGSEVDGDELRSSQLLFSPDSVAPGRYDFRVNTAGAMPLVLHTVIYPLCLSDRPSHLEFHGGTHVSWAPHYEYLAEIWQNTLQKLGIEVKLELHRAGYYPKGGGRFSAHITPCNGIRPFQALQRGPLTELKLICISSSLPEHVAQRELKTLERYMKDLQLSTELTTEVREYKAHDSANLLFLKAGTAKAYAGFTAMGQRGKKAEKVARELFHKFRDYYHQENPIEQHLADQLLLPLSLAQGPSRFRVDMVTQHLLTNAYIIGLFGIANIKIEGKEGTPGEVSVAPRKSSSN